MQVSKWLVEWLPGKDPIEVGVWRLRNMLDPWKSPVTRLGVADWAICRNGGGDSSRLVSAHHWACRSEEDEDMEKYETGEAAQDLWNSRWQGENLTRLGKNGPLVIVVNWSEGHPARRSIQGKRARRGKFLHDEICRERISIERRKLEGGTLENLVRGVS